MTFSLVLPSSPRKFPVGVSRARVIKYVHLKCVTNCATRFPRFLLFLLSNFVTIERGIFSRIEILILLLFCSLFQCKRCLEHQFLWRVEVTGVFACRLKLFSLFASEAEQSSPSAVKRRNQSYVNRYGHAEFGRSETQRIQSHCGK